MRLAAGQIRTREVTRWQGLHLLHYQMSSCSQKVRILIGELGIDYVSHHVNLMRNEQRTDWFLGINPHGLVPVLVHDGEVHIESNDIIEYLDQAFARAECSLLPATDAERRRMRELMDLEDVLHTDLRTVTFTYLAPPGAGTAASPEPLDLDFIGRFHDAFSQLDDTLEQSPYLLGERLSLADISWFITLHRLFLAGYPLKAHAHLFAFYRRIALRPAFRTQLNSGPLLLRAAGAVYRIVNRLFRHSMPHDFERWRLESATTR